MRAKPRLITRLREKKGWRQRDLADVTPLSLRTVQRAEKGEPVVLSTLQEIANALQVKVREILFEPGPPHGVREVNFIQHLDEEPGPYFKSPAILEKLAVVQGTVEVLGRTCRSWLVGSGDETKLLLQDLVVQAARNRSEIYLVVQKSTVRVPFFSQDDMTLLREHLNESVQSYREIQKRLGEEGIPKKRVQLFFTDQPLLQSMTRIKIGGETWLLVSVRTDFKPDERRVFAATPPSVGSRPRAFKWDPQIIFRMDAPQAEEYDFKFEAILKGGRKRHKRGDPIVREPVLYGDYRARLLRRIHEAVSHYNDEHGSALRDDTGANLAAQAVRHFLARSLGRASVPPVCVNLLVTSRCPGHCLMCTQWNRNLPDPSTEEVKDLLRHISALGARSVVLSGGDPLYRDDIFDILEFASSETEAALSIMTRGIRRKDSRQSALREKDADRLADACRWIQISMDTFSTSTGGTVQSNRGGADAKKAATSAKRIWDAVEEDKSRAEICFTIHKGNIGEIDGIPHNARRIGIPEGMPIRLKFAHSLETDAEFLCSQHDLWLLRGTLRRLRRHKNLNAEYLWRSMELDSEMIRNVANGHPVETALRHCEKRGDKCYVRDLICTIDCNGSVYLCCYLFDDTATKSDTRKPIGNLRDRHGDILPFDVYSGRLKDIWQRRPAPLNLRVDQLACGRCTRHLHQNELLNKIHRILDEGSPLLIAEELENALKQKKVVDGCEWCSEEDEYFWL